jgi:cell division septal protein FtsQ
MWGRRRRDNRRGHQRYTLLNVDLPIEKVRQQRLRWAIRSVGFIFGIVLIFLCVWHGGSWLMKAGFYHNDHFIVKTIDIRTNGLIDPEQIRVWARIHKGENLFGLDLQRVKRDLEMVPQIKTAAVDRVLPKTLRLRITERRPLAQVVAYKQHSEGQLQKEVYWLDAEGIVMAP